MTTINLQVAASSDDAFQASDASITLNTATIILISGSQWAGVRWDGVTVPQAATIVSATAQFYTPSTTEGDIVGDWYGEDVDDATTFAFGSNNISGRPRTTAKTTVNAAVGSVGWYSISVTSVVQEIVDRAGWSSGNALNLIFDVASGCNWRFRTWDFAGNAHGPKLDIDYTTGGATSQPMAARGRQVPGMRRPHNHQGW